MANFDTKLTEINKSSKRIIQNLKGFEESMVQDLKDFDKSMDRQFNIIIFMLFVLFIAIYI